MIGSWPVGEESVRAQFRDPACQYLREVPDDYRPVLETPADDPCAAIKLRSIGAGIVMRTVADYDRWIFNLKVKSVIYTLLLWLVPVAALYGGGWIVGRAIRGRRK